MLPDISHTPGSLWLKTKRQKHNVQTAIQWRTVQKTSSHHTRYVTTCWLSIEWPLLRLWILDNMPRDHQKMHASAKQPWRNHYNAISGDWIAKYKRSTCNNVRIRSSKTSSQRQNQKKRFLKHFLHEILKGKSPAPNLWQSADDHCRNLDTTIPPRFTMFSAV